MSLLQSLARRKPTPPTPVALSRRQSAQRGEPPQAAALGTRPTHWLNLALFPPTCTSHEE
ncbi:MAG: hypothetical protein KME23_19020 [Goleter apudmare HA4340-LM2]|nr:hypothetical protein [Goleter apudmare HA4340-LM2]